MTSTPSKDRRQAQIRALLATRGRLTATELASVLKVTEMTIRRDLDAMQTTGLLLRVYGGAQLRSAFVQEQSFSEKVGRNPARKQAIAQRAVRLLTRGMALYLDTGTTAARVAHALPAGLDLHLFTNNLRAVMDLFGRQDVTVHVCGGLLMPRSPDLVGTDAVARLAEIRTDLAFVGADAIDPDTGEIFAADAETAALSRIAQRQTNRMVVLADSSKIGARGQAVTGHLRAGVTLITDDHLSRALRRRLARHPAEVLYAPVATTAHNHEETPP